jgi:hypothetical protein
LQLYKIVIYRAAYNKARDSMNKRNIPLLLLIAMCSWGSVTQGFGPKTIINARSVSVDLMRELLGWQQEILPFSDDENEMYLAHSLTVEYDRSFDPAILSNILFGCPSMVFSGSGVPNRAPTDILADYFGLARDFKSLVTFTPVITNLVVDFQWYHGLDAWLPGLYYMIHIPVVHSKWDLDLCERVVNPGTAYADGATYPAGYLGSQRILLEDLPQSVEKALEGTTVFGDMGDPLQYGKVFGRQTLTRTAELQLALGWNFYRSDWYTAGFALRAALPTGNPSTAEFLFEPMIGNGGHWELGFNITNHINLWRSVDARHMFAFYLDANITHLFPATQKRSFDITSAGNGSRYMLITDNGSPSNDLFFDSVLGTPAETQYQQRLFPAINQTTFEIKTRIDIQADVVAQFVYMHDNVEFDFGYNFWVRSKEKGERCQRLESNRFGLKGDAQLYGFTVGQEPRALNVTQSKSTINAGQGAGNANFTNANADNPQEAFSDTTLFQLTAVDASGLGLTDTAIDGSNPAIFLQDSDINECSGLSARAITHRIFAHVNYAWHQQDDYTPYLGIGGMGEWAQKGSNDNGYSQWGIWLKGGLAY